MLDPQWAQRRRIGKGQRLRLASPYGEVIVRARLSPGIIPGALGLNQGTALRVMGSSQNSTGSLDASAIALRIALI